MIDQDIIIQSSREPRSALFSAFYLRLVEMFPGSAILESNAWPFMPYETSKNPPWTFEKDATRWSRTVFGFRPHDRTHAEAPTTGWYRANYQDGEVVLAHISQASDFGSQSRWYIIGSSEAVVKGFFQLVCDYFSQVRGEVLVFAHGCWTNSTELYEDIQQSRLADLVLAGTLKEQIVQDLEIFLKREEEYQKFKIPYKRGILLLGPPGNGKTHLIRALVSHFGIPCLYVKSFECREGSQFAVERAFERAREVRKCFFILEDLDTLLTASNRTYFLNELDGFAANHGIITIATCNFAELLDPAITERPSRFDRKVHFNLPSPTERRRYLALYQERFEPEMRLGDDGLHQITAATEGFSFAYLKELMVSSAMHWVSFDGAENFQDVVSAQVTSLGEQMKTEWKKMKEASVSTQGHSADESEGFDGD